MPMHCPVDQTELVMTERQGVEIDYCPKCRGIWLDRGELDKIIERAGSEHPAPREYYQEHSQRSYNERPQTNHKQKHKRENFLEDLFDF